jgi:hypothetical protein
MRQQTSPLRFILKTLVGAAAVAGLLIGAVMLVSPLRQGPLAGIAMTPLGDGTFVSVPQVTVGAVHNWRNPRERTLWEWLSGAPQPQPLESRSHPAGMMVWVVLHDGRTSAPKHWPALRHARLTAREDVVGTERVIVFRSQNDHRGPWSSDSFGLPISQERTAPTAGQPIPAYVYGFCFPLFPAGCGPFKLELLGELPGEDQPWPVLATLEFPEPAGLNPPPPWTASPLPAVSTVGPHSLTLERFWSSGYSSRGKEDPYSIRHAFGPNFSLTSGGQSFPVHLFKTGPLVDSAGNVFESGYSGEVGPWFGPQQLTVTAQIPTPEALRVASTCESPLVDVPVANTVVPLSPTFELRSGRIRGRIATIGGRGETSQADPPPGGPAMFGHGVVGAQLSNQGRSLTFRVYRDKRHRFPGRSPDTIGLRVEADLVHVLYSAEGLTPSEWLGVDQVLDDQSRPVPHYDYEYCGTRIVFADPLPDAKSLRLRFLVRDSADFTFVVDPPSPEKK